MPLIATPRLRGRSTHRERWLLAWRMELAWEVSAGPRRQEPVLASWCGPGPRRRQKPAPRAGSRQRPPHGHSRHDTRAAGVFPWLGAGPVPSPTAALPTLARPASPPRRPIPPRRRGCSGCDSPGCRSPDSPGSGHGLLGSPPGTLPLLLKGAARRPCTPSSRSPWRAPGSPEASSAL